VGLLNYLDCVGALVCLHDLVENQVSCHDIDLEFLLSCLQGSASAKMGYYDAWE
jgi:hypothetical protein